ncbi:MAG: hypothetical protein P9M03_07540 [Candidatus Theseobacter exili]|nr:hypothetical protein [Candidatus Theseobacter exili]
MKKAILISLSVVVILVAGVIIFTLSNLDSIVKSVIEKVGTKVVGTTVSVGSVDISMSNGQATIKRLKVSNPPGFSRKPIISCGEVTAQIEIKTGVINKIIIVSPHFRYEEKGSENNFQVIQNNMKSGSQSAKKRPSADMKEKEPVIYQIDLFNLKDAEVVFVSDESKEKEPQMVQISDITLKNLKGTDQQIGMQIMGQLVNEIITTVAKKFIKKEVDKAIKKNLGDKMGGFLKTKKK